MAHDNVTRPGEALKAANPKAHKRTYDGNGDLALKHNKPVAKVEHGEKGTAATDARAKAPADAVAGKKSAPNPKSGNKADKPAAATKGGQSGQQPAPMADDKKAGNGSNSQNQAPAAPADK